MPPEPKTLFPVQLVGAGPGAADLLTLRAARVIEGAQALLYDALVGEDILALAPQACLKIQTGKRAGRPSMRQETINRLMVRLARRGLRVVRLKGGDPSIFGRDGELTMDWTAAADAEATLAIYMGARAAPVIARHLIAAGRSPQTPVAVVSNASTPGAKFEAMTLATLAAAHCLGLEAGPALILVGEALAASEAWLPDDETERLVGAA